MKNIVRRQNVIVVSVLLLMLVILNSCRATTSPTLTEPSTLQTDTWSARVIYQGHIWYYGQNRLSCQQVCAPHGGCDRAGMALIGSKTSAPICRAVLNELGVPINAYETGDARHVPHVVDVSWQSAQWRVGCAYVAPYGDAGIRLLYSPASAVANGPDDPEFAMLNRACACNK
jgi:hypothetical protein